MARFCYNCGKELNENADICLNCGVFVNKKGNDKNINTNSNSKNKKSGIPVWGIILIVIGCILFIPLFILILFFVFTFNVAKSVPDNYVEEAGNYIDGYLNEDEVNVVGEGTIDDTLEIDGMKFTLNSVVKYSEISNDYFNNIPDDGNEYLVFFMNVENTSDENKTITYLNFTGIVDDEDIISEFIFDKIDGKSNLNTTLKPLESTTGYVIFEVNKEWNNFDLHYKEIAGNDEIIFYVTNEDKMINDSI